MLGYAGALGLAHFLVIGKPFAYQGFEPVPPNPLHLLLVALPYYLCIRRLPSSWERPSALVYWALFGLVVAPVHVLPVFIEQPDPSVWIMVYTVAGCFWLLGGIYSIEPPRLPRPTVPPRIYWAGFAVTALGMLALLLATYGLHFEFTSWSSFYDVRGEFKDAREDAPRITGYVLPWLGQVLAPIAIARGLLNRSVPWLVGGVLTELLLVSMTGYKSLLFSSALIIGIVLIARFTDVRKIGLRISVLATSSVLAVTLLDVVLNNTTLSSLLVRRGIMVAGLNTRYFFEFFSDFPKLHLGHSVLGFWVDYPYETSPPNLIGLVYYGNPYTSANVNIWADAYSNFGVLGMLVFTALLGMALLLVDASTRAGAPRLLVLAPLAMIALGLSNSALLTVFMTHGLLLTLILVYLMPRGMQPESASGQP